MLVIWPCAKALLPIKTIFTCIFANKKADSFQLAHRNTQEAHNSLMFYKLYVLAK